MTRRRGRRRREPLDDLKDRRGYSHLKEEAVDGAMWRNCFRGGFGPVVRILNDDDDVSPHRILTFLGPPFSCASARRRPPLEINFV